MSRGGLLAVIGASALGLALPAPARAAAPEKQPDGIVVAVGDGVLRLAFCTDAIVRVTYARDRAFLARPSLATEPKRCEATPWQLASGHAEATLSTPRMKVRVDLGTGAVAFLDARRRSRSSPSGRAAGPSTPAEVQGERTFHVRQQWKENARRGALRPRPAAARARRPQGLRPRPLAAQRDRRRAVPRLEPRLRHPVGQHVVHPLRRPAAPGSPSRPRGCSTRRASPAA